MHRPLRAYDASSVGLADALMAETHAEDRNASAQLTDDIDRHAGFVRRAGSRRDDDVRWTARQDSADIDRIVAHDLRLVSQLAQIPCEVVDEGVIVVDDENQRSV